MENLSIQYMQPAKRIPRNRHSVRKRNPRKPQRSDLLRKEIFVPHGILFAVPNHTVLFG